MPTRVDADIVLQRYPSTKSDVLEFEVQQRTCRFAFLLLDVAFDGLEGLVASHRGNR